MNTALPRTLARPHTTSADDAGPPVRPIVHAAPSRRALGGARLAIVATVVTWLAYVVHSVWLHLTGPGLGEPRILAILVVAIVGVTLLTFSALMYLVARLGAMHRLRAHVRVPRAELDEHFTSHHSTITVLVPSYAEEPRVVRTTLWSAALQEFHSTRVVLLLDDPPPPHRPRGSRPARAHAPPGRRDPAGAPGAVHPVPGGPREVRSDVGEPHARGRGGARTGI